MPPDPNGLRITELPLIATVQPDDQLVIVDVHNQFEAPSGTTSRVPVGLLTPGLLGCLAGVYPQSTSEYLRGDGQWAVPPGGSTPSIQSQAMSTSTGQFSASKVVTLLSAAFSAAARLRLYSNAADQAADQSRAVGVPPSVADILYEFNGDSNNTDSVALTVYPGNAATVYWQLDGGATATVTWVQELST